MVNGILHINTLRAFLKKKKCLTSMHLTDVLRNAKLTPKKNTF